MLSYYYLNINLTYLNRINVVPTLVKIWIMGRTCSGELRTGPIPFYNQQLKNHVLRPNR